MPRRYISLYASAIAYLALYDPGHALALLEQAVDDRYPWAIHYNIDPLLDALRPDPRFKALLERIGIPELPVRPPS